MKNEYFLFIDRLMTCKVTLTNLKKTWRRMKKIKWKGCWRELTHWLPKRNARESGLWSTRNRPTSSLPSPGQRKHAFLRKSRDDLESQLNACVNLTATILLSSIRTSATWSKLSKTLSSTWNRYYLTVSFKRINYLLIRQHFFCFAYHS